MQKQHKTWEKYYNRKRIEGNIKVKDLVLVQTHFIRAVGRRIVGKFMPKFEGPNRVLEVRNNNLTIWKKRRRVTVNIDQVQMYHPRHSDTNSFDSINETLYEGKGSSNSSKSGKSRRSRKPSGNESKSGKSNKGTAGLDDLRFKRKVVSTGTAERYDRKRSKICRKQSIQASKYKENKRKAPVLPQGKKRGVPSSISSRTRKYVRNSFYEHTSQGPETIVGPSHQQQMRQLIPHTEESRRGARVQSDKARETRTTGSKGHSAAEGIPVRSGKTTTVRPCPYYVRCRFKEPEGIAGEQRNTGIDGLQQNSLRRRSLRLKAFDGDPADRST
ncbi:uncharacterized protein TNCV_2922341 [Trichonephila clavipes]|nr:uncharacterized protein TNCV_2922341 [Trichonephila clavipes]